MEIILCGMAKKENKYINEWCKYHLSLGFDHIYLYDNNDIDYPYVGDYIDDSLKEKITIFDWRGKKNTALLSLAYLNCYHNQKFDWCAFLDIDEFLVGVSDIHEFFNTNKFDNIEQIRIMWEWFGDDEVIERDETIPVMDFFKIKVTNDHNNVGKFILRSGLNLHTIEPHFARGLTTSLITCFPSGKLSPESAISLYIAPNGEYQKTETVYINHYMTKTLKEFLDQKYKTRDVMVQTFGPLRGLDYFWHLNKQTPEKIDYIKKYLEKK